MPRYLTLCAGSLIWAWSTLSSVPITSAQDQAASAEAPHAVAVIQISEQALSNLVDREIHRHTKVTDNFQGTPISGRAQTYGRPRIVLHPEEEAAAFEIVLSGTTSSRTVGDHYPVWIHSHADTKFTATKRIEFKPGHGFLALPADIKSETTNHIDAITLQRRGLFRNMILNRARQQVGALEVEAQAFAKLRAEQRILAAFEAVLEDRLDQLNRDVDLRSFAEGVFAVKLGPAYQCSTTPDYLQLVVSSDPSQPCSCQLPELPVERQPLQVWLHRSLLSKELQAGLALIERANQETKILQSTAGLMPTIDSLQGVKLAAKTSSQVAGQSMTWTTAPGWLVLQFSGEQVALKSQPRKNSTTTEDFGR